MNVEQSIAHLKNIGFVVFKEGDKYDIHRIGAKEYCHSPKYSDEPMDKKLYTERELVKFAKKLSSEDNYLATAKKLVKDGSKSKRRANDRNLLNSKDIDKIEELSSFRDSKTDDIWNYD